jgi:hypothetical protein
MARVDSKSKIAASLMAAVVAPIVAMSLYLWLSRWPQRLSSSFSDNAAFAVCILIGVVLVAALPLRPWLRAAAAVASLPLLYALLFFYSLIFVGVAFGDWL